MKSNPHSPEETRPGHIGHGSVFKKLNVCKARRDALGERGCSCLCVLCDFLGWCLVSCNFLSLS